MSLKEIFMNWIMPDRDPVAVCKVKGFEISVEKKEGVLLKSKPENPSDDPKPASLPFYFEVSARPNGKNHEYPAADQPSKFCFTNLNESQGQAFGFLGGACAIPHDAKFTRFELREEFNDAKNYMGRRPASHHGVSVHAYYKSSEGRESSMAIGGWVRKSDLESPKWEAAKKDRTMWM